MSPFRKIEEAYDKAGHAEPFLYFVRLYLDRGFVFSRPDIFVMGRPVPKSATVARIMDDHEWFNGEEKDSWFIHSAAGNTARMWQIMPYELPWFCWTRMRPETEVSLTFCPGERLRRLCPPDLKAVLQPANNE